VRLLAATAAGELSLLPWLLVALPQFQHAGNPFWIKPITTLVPDVSGTIALAPAEIAVTVAPWIGAMAAILLLLTLFRQLAPPARRGATYVLACAVAPTAAVILVSLWKPLYDVRFAGIFWASAVVLLGVALTVLRWRLVAVAIVAALMVADVVIVLQVHNPDFDALTAPIAARADPGDLVVVNGPTHYFSVAYALGPDRAGGIKVVADNIPWFDGVAAYPPGTQVSTVPNTSGRIFLVTALGQPAPEIPPGFVRIDRGCQDTVCLETYRRVDVDRVAAGG
jgi:hypothetical protein